MRGENRGGGTIRVLKKLSELKSVCESNAIDDVHYLFMRYITIKNKATLGQIAWLRKNTKLK